MIYSRTPFRLDGWASFFIEFLQEGGGGSIPELRSGGLLRSPESRSDSMEPPHLPAGTFQKEKYC